MGTITKQLGGILEEVKSLGKRLIM